MSDDADGPHGHCDTCGAPCDADGCTRDREHAAALDISEFPTIGRTEKLVDFWAVVNAQLAELRSARSADDVLRILSRERDPYGPDHAVAGEGFFAGGGGEDNVEDALLEAGWTHLWRKAWYYHAMRAPDGSAITYVEGDIYRGEPPEQRP